MLLVMFQVQQEISETKLQSFPASTWERGYFSVLFRFSNFGLQSLQKYSSKSLQIYD